MKSVDDLQKKMNGVESHMTQKENGMLKYMCV